MLVVQKTSTLTEKRESWCFLHSSLSFVESVACLVVTILKFEYCVSDHNEIFGEYIVFDGRYLHILDSERAVMCFYYLWLIPYLNDLQRNKPE